MTTLDLNFLGHKDTIASFIYETSEGPVLIETGPYSTFSKLEKAVNEAGFKLKEIKHVFLTHIHFDHAGAAWAMAKQGATVYVHPKGAPHLIAPEKLVESARRIYKDDMDRLWGEIQPIKKESVRIVEHDEVITIGNTSIHAWHTPGHAKHHIAWQIGDQLFSGDVGGVKIEGGPVVPPCPPPDINIEHWKESIALIRKLDLKAMYLTHFGKVENIQEHLDELEKALDAWTRWMRPQFEAGRPVEEITPEFTTFVRKGLIEKGVEGEQLLRYEGANPSWMSVAGLLRYWKKKLQQD